MPRRSFDRRSRILLASLSTTLASAIALAAVLLFSGARAEAAPYTLTSTAPITNWSDVTKWNGGTGTTYPGQSAGDTATVSLGGTTLNINVPIAFPVTLNVSNSIPVTIPSGGSLVLEASSSATSQNTITIQTGGTLGVSSTATLSLWQGPITVSGGTFAVNGSLTFAAGSSLTVNAGTINGSGTLTIPSGHFASFNGSGGAMALDTVTFVNAGTVTFSGANALSINNGATFNNQTTFNYQTNSAINTNAVSSPKINNSGTLNVLTGFSPTINATVNNTGTIILSDTGSAQTLTLAGGGTHTGSFSLTSNPSSMIAFSGAHIFNSPWSWGASSNSTFKLIGGTSTVNSSFSTPNFVQTGGLLGGTGNVTASSNFTWQGGTESGPGATIINGPGSINGTTAMTLDNRPFTVSGGSLVYNPGAGGSLAFTNTSALTMGGGSFDLQGDTTITSDATSHIDITGGTLGKTAGTKTIVGTILNINGNGIIQPSAGTTISFGNGGSLGGTSVSVNTSALNSALEFSGGTTNLNGGVTFTSGNLGLVSPAILSINTNNTVSTLKMTGGTLAGTNTLSAGTFNWTGGVMDGGGIGTGALLVINTANINGASATEIRDHWTLTNAGTVHYQPSSPLAVNAGGLIQNNGSWLLENGAAMTSDLTVFVTGPTFTNVGTLSKLIAGTTSFGVPLAAGGTIQTNNAADIELTGGGTFTAPTIQFLNSADVLGIQTNAVTIASSPSVSGSGTVRVGATGTLINSAVTTIPNFEIDNGGTLSGGGTLNITAGMKATGGTFTGNGTTNLGSGASGDLTSLAGNVTFNIHTFNNAGTINYNPAFPLAFPGSGHFVNQPAGILNITGAGGTSTSGTANTFVNQGTINRSGAATFFTFDLPFTNSGTVDAQSASNFVAFNNGGSMSAGTMKGSVASAGIEFGGGTFNVTGGTWGTVGGIKVNGGVLNINTAMTAPAGVALISGTLGSTASGSLTMNSGSTANLKGGTVSNVTLNANSGGFINFDTTSATLTLDGASLTYNAGSSGQWIGGNTLSMLNAASIADSGTVTWGASGNVAVSGATPTITVNSGGTLQKTTSASPIGVGANLQNNGGTVSSQAGQLQLNYAGTSNHTGTFDAGAGAEVLFGANGGTSVFNGISGTGVGFLHFIGGINTFTANSTLTNLKLDAATIDGAGTLTFTGTFDWNSGDLDTPTVNSGGTLNLNGVGVMNLGANLTSGANFSSPTNAFNIGSGFTFTNNGTFDITGGAAINGPGTFTNSGTLTKSSAGTTVLSAPFNNSSQVDVNSGNLTISAGGSDSGTYNSSAGTTLAFTGGTRTFTNLSLIGAGAGGTTLFSGGAFTVSGGFQPLGPVTINGGTVALNAIGGASINGLTLTAGTLSGTTPLDLSGTNSWTGGTITGTGSFTLNPGATLGFNSGSGAALDGRALTNIGTITGSVPLQSLDLRNGASIFNHTVGIFDLAGSFSLTNSSGAATFSNAGLFRKSCCISQTSSVAPVFTNTGNVDAQLGTIDFTSFTQSAGTTKLTGGALSSAATMNFSGGSLAGAGSINAALTNSGATIDPGDPVTPGALTVNGTFNQTAGTLVTDLFANNSNDQLLVPGNTATVAGNLNVQLAGGYVPASGDTFTLINAGTLTDTTTKSYPAFGPNNTGFFTPTTTATTLSLAAVIPQADVDVSAATAAATVVHNNSWTITIPVTNHGPAGATGVTVTVTPSNGTLTGLVTTQGTCTGNSCSVGSLASSASATITATINATTLSSVSATVTASANESDPVGTNNSKVLNATVTPQADLALAITDSPDPVNAGGSVTYNYKVTNNGPDAASYNVAATITNGTISSASACTATATTANCGTFSLASGGNAVFSIVVTAPGSGPVTASGTVTPTNATDQTPVNDSTNQVTTVTPQADLQITKTGPASSSAGSNITYTIAVKNNGPSDAASVVVSDTPGAGLTFVGNSGACSGTFPCSLGTLTNGTTATILATYSTSPSSTATSVTNTASVTSTTADPAGTNNSSTATTPLGASADVAVSVTGPSTGSPGSGFTLTVKVQNNGPSAATGVTLSATNSSSISFDSNTGACNTPYPCALGTLNPGQFVTINSTYGADAGGSTSTATFTAATSTSDPNSANNSASHTITTSCPSNAPSQLVPYSNQPNVGTSGTLLWNDVGAATYNVYLGPAGSGCTTFYGARSMTFTRDTALTYALLQPGTTYEWAVEAVTPNCPTRKSACVTFTTATNCNAAAPQPVSPLNGTVASPVTFNWTASNGATLYTVKNAADDSVIGTSTSTSLPNIVIPDGPFTWYVVADVPQCGQLRSANATFNGCSIPPAPVVGAVSEAATGQTYSVQWDRILGVASYDLEEATNAAFTDVVVTTIPQPASGPVSMSFTKSTSQGALTFFYRVRAKSLCNQAFGPYSTDIRVVVLPPPPKTQKNPSVTVPAGSTLIVVQQVFVPGINDGIVHAFTATVDKPWLSVEPASGILPADGITLDVKANPTNLPNGTETGTVIVTITTPSSGKTGSNGAAVVTVPISVNLVTPVIPSTKDLPPDSTLMIPSVGHLDGLNSHWQSDIRLANTGSQKLQYALKFTPADPSNGGVKTTTIDVDGGATAALDDIVRNWYGIGVLGESANGVLEIRPLTPSGKGAPDATAPSVSKVTVVSSRTYTTGDNGTLGQFIPAIPFSSFIGKATQQAAAAVLSLQQIAQSSQYRTNVGIVEGSGQPANVLISIFDVTGKKLKDVPLSLKGGQQLQAASFLASVGIPSLDDGRIEVKVTSGEGRVTAYASVVDNKSTDPLLVTGVRLAGATADNYVVPGVADINTGAANWRTDLRIFNGAAAAQNATVTFFRQGASPLAQNIVINAGEIRALDSIVQSLFGVSNAGGAVHVTTSGNSSLIVSGRTYNATPAGTYGQFIPAVTTADSIAAGDRPLQILQAEDSVRYRTNLGLAEVTGKPVGVDVLVNLPDSKVTPVVHVDLAPNDFQQFNVFRALGMENVYNARISIRVTDGDGRITAYGSVVDMLTSDPTYVPALQ